MLFLQPPTRRVASGEPPASHWRDRATYDGVLVDQFLVPLHEAAERLGQVPLPQQIAALNRLHWYFTVDARPVSPTLVVDDALAQTFHARVRDVMRYIDAESVSQMAGDAGAEVRHALLSYKDVKGHSDVQVDAFDAEQGLARLTYWVHGEPPAERVFVDGREVAAAFFKYRACRYFRRNLLRQRIAWIPVDDAAISLQVVLGDRDARVGVGPQRFSIHSGAVSKPDEPASNDLLRQARAVFDARRGASPEAVSGWARWKAKVLKALARASFVRARFRDAWVFADREQDADDNAEHLYRWVREHHPEINAWFLLQRGTADWRRLEREGFRLMGPGLRRKLLLLNSVHVIASHPDHADGRFDRRLYGDAMRWRFTYLKHGVVYNDLSHFYADRRFDLVVAPSPAEFEAFVGDDTPYQLTRREVIRCNAPRHDRLLQLASECGTPDEIVVMPTWRGRLIDDELPFEERLRRMRASEYARAWRELLNDPDLAGLAREHAKRIVFVPHSNLVPYLEAFDIPPHVEVASRDRSIQEHFARCFVFITDYTSAAFDIALLRRHVVYFQFDRERFFSGDHNWRPGYFDYARDGFGPVVATTAGVVKFVQTWVAAPSVTGDSYRRAMERAMPDTGTRACSRLLTAIKHPPGMDAEPHRVHAVGKTDG